MLWDDHIFIGTYKSDYKDYITAKQMGRSPIYKELFPHKIVKEFDLVKSKIEARMHCTLIVVFSR
jgi:hypothetical protein